MSPPTNPGRFNLWEDYCVDLQNDMYFQCNDYCEGPEYQDWAAF